MKSKILKLMLSAAAASASVYFKKMLVPVGVLLAAMAADYISGVTAAWFEGKLNSAEGKKGAVRKVCYMFLVIVAGIIDWILISAGRETGIDISVNFYFGTLVAVWLILNELLSILENCTKMGLPVPKFIKPIAERLKTAVEEEADND